MKVEGRGFKGNVVIPTKGMWYSYIAALHDVILECRRGRGSSFPSAPSRLHFTQTSIINYVLHEHEHLLFTMNKSRRFTHPWVKAKNSIQNKQYERARTFHTKQLWDLQAVL